MSTPRLRLAHITKRYPAVVANDDVTLAVQPNEIHAVLGENGAGKSTLMKIAFGAVQPDAGTIEIDGRDVIGQDPVALRREIGYVIQQVGLFPHQRVEANVMTVPLLLGESRATARERAHELMDLVGLDVETWGRLRRADDRTFAGVSIAVGAAAPTDV